MKLPLLPKMNATIARFLLVARQDNVPGMKSLLNNINLEKHGSDILKHVMLNNTPNALELLLRNPKIKPSASDNTTIITAASCKGYTNVIKWMLENGKIDKDALESALENAKENGHERIVDLLKQEGHFLSQEVPQNRPG